MKKAYIGAEIMNRNGIFQNNAVLLIKGAHIEAVTDEDHIPSDYEQVNVKGKYITPGLIDVHTHLGVHEEGIGPQGADFNETSQAVTPAVRALDGIHPLEEGFELARRSGVTTVQILPGSANVIGGEMVIIKTSGSIVDEMVLLSPSGMKAAFGENPKRIHSNKSSGPVTRMGNAALFREAMIKAQNYRDKCKKDPKAPRDLGMEQLVSLLEKRIPLRAHAHRADDIATVVRLAEEFDLRYTIEHCTEGHLIADFLARHQVTASVGPTMSTKSKTELSNKSWETLSALDEHGVDYCITTDHPVVGIDHLLTSAMTAHKEGLSEAKALSSITVFAARHLGMEETKGSLEKAKDADFVVWSHHPFDVKSLVEQTFIEGMQVYSRNI